MRILAAIFASLIGSPWVLAAAAAAVLGSYVYVYTWGYGDAAAKCREAELRATIASLERDLQRQRIADSYRDAYVAWLQSGYLAELKKERDDYVVEIEERPAVERCPAYKPRDVERLRRLRNLKAPAG
jgi:hypothetical protein